jgi:hypothetical protein
MVKRAAAQFLDGIVNRGVKERGDAAVNLMFSPERPIRNRWKLAVEIQRDLANVFSCFCKPIAASKMK